MFPKNPKSGREPTINKRFHLVNMERAFALHRLEVRIWSILWFFHDIRQILVRFHIKYVKILAIWLQLDIAGVRAIILNNPIQRVMVLLTVYFLWYQVFFDFFELVNIIIKLVNFDFVLSIRIFYVKELLWHFQISIDGVITLCRIICLYLVLLSFGGFNLGLGFLF
jgi:hypothetical protein